MIVVDDMNGYSPRDQYPAIKTPYLDKFRSEAVNFINAACNSPVCNPSRSSFFSGLYPHTTGAYLNGSDGWNRSEILKEIRNIPEWFKDNGYTTWGRGKMLHNPLDSARENYMWDNRPIYKGGFGPFGDEEHQYSGRFFSIQPWEKPDTDFPDVINADAAVEFLKQDHNKPFFMYYGLWRPHSPYTAPKRFFDMYNEDEIKFADSYKEDDLNDTEFLGRMLVDSLKRFDNKGMPKMELVRKFLYAYCANTSFADWNVGKVIEALDESKYAGNTIVVFFSDNGFHCGEKERWGKATLWDQSDYVPFMVRTPERNGDVSKATVSLIDVFPTLIDFCNLPMPEQQMDGKSMVPLLSNPNAEWDRPSFTSYGPGYSSVRTERFRYSQYPDGTVELYDHHNDPFEFNNIANEPDMKDIIEKMKREIPVQWAPSTGGRLEVDRDFEEVKREWRENNFRSNI